MGTCNKRFSTGGKISGIILGTVWAILNMFILKKAIMKSTKLKLFFLAAGFFAVSSTFAQDTTNKHKTDTSRMPKHDSTTMIKAAGSSTVSGTMASAINAPATKKEDNKIEAKKEGGQ
jgi:uncharacterized membrane protein